MKALLVENAPPLGGWTYEIKYDGFRALALIRKDEVQLLSSNRKDLGTRFPEIVQSLGQLKLQDAAIDGEIVALDPEGRSSFQCYKARR